MLARATLHVLAQLAEIGVPEAVGVPIAAFDPFLRPWLRRRVRRAVAEAAARTTQDAPEHVLRLAFLLRHPSRPEPLDVNDVSAVDQAYRNLSSPFTGVPPERPRPRRL